MRETIIVLVLIAIYTVPGLAFGWAAWDPGATPEPVVWVVAKNQEVGDRPVKYLGGPLNGRYIPDLRAPEGAACGPSTRRNQAGTRQWRLWRVGSRAVGEVYCEVQE